MKLPESLNRIGFTFGAQVYNQIVTVAVQLLIVPLLIGNWGVEQYGGWLVLYAVPSYLTLTDFGLTAIAKNIMVMRGASHDDVGVLRVYHSVFAFLLGAAIVIGCGTVLGVYSVTIRSVLNIGQIDEQAAKLVILFLIGNVVINQFFLLLCAGVRASGRPAAEVTWGATGRLLEGVATVAAASISTDVRIAAIAIFSVRAACIAILWVWLRVVAKDISLGMSLASVSEIRAMANPSFSFMLLGLAQAVAIQGPIVLLGIVATPAATVLFSTSRTLARIGTSIANVVNFSFAPEYSRLHGRGDRVGFANLERFHGRIGIAGILIYGLGLWMFGPWLMREWTHGKVLVVQPFFGLMNAAVIAEMLWIFLFTPISSINRHVRISYLFVALTVASAVPAWYGAVVVGPTGIAVVLLCLHLAMCAILLIAKPESRANH